ncbi:MAG: hypothetical protein ACLGG5_03720 [Thermoleophilia bacterium]
MSKRLVLLCVLLVPTLALSACGGGSGSGDESKIEEAIEASATAATPAACTEFQTQKFTEQTTQESGKAAVEQCEEEAEKEEGASSVKVSNVSVSGSDATAEAALSGGGGLDGQTVEVSLVKEGDQWKLDEAVKFTKFDQGKLVEGFEREIEKSGEVSSKFATCLIGALKQIDQTETEELFFHSSGQGFEEIAKECS